MVETRVVLAYTLAAVVSIALLYVINAVREVARVYVFGLPIAMNYATMVDYVVNDKSPNFKHVGFNEFHHEHRTFTHEDTSIVTPNADTPYSIAWLDLRGGGCVVGTDDVEEGRYFSLQFVDGNTYNYGYIGSRTTGNSATKYLVVQRGWKGDVPDDVDGVLYSTTPFSLVIGRTQLFSGDDMKNVERTQRGFSVEKLGKTTPPGPFGFATASDVETHRFFDVLDSALEFVPVNESNADEMRAAGGVGLGPLKKGGRRASWLILDLGRYFGTRKVDKYAMKLGHVVNSWDISEGGGDERRYGGRWVERAAVAKVGIYALDPEEAVYPFTATGSRGRRISGANRYTITFDGKSMPPANAFWSITAYDAKTRLLTKNRIDRYLVNSPMLPGMKKSADGNVTIYIGSESPGGDLENNWLPTTKGDVFLVMRIYWPKTGAPSVLPPGRGSWKPPHLQLRK